MERTKKIVRTSILGILVNLVLVGFKALVGFLSGSIAILLDAVNNLSDALSSVITVIGAKLAARKPNRKHPFGLGRIEDLTSMLISVIVLTAGATSLWESIQKMIHPEAADYSAVTIVVIVAAVVTKFVLGVYVRRVGAKIRSDALIAMGSDAFFDAILSIGTLVAAVISLVWHLSVEGYVGALISFFILKAGIGLLSETLGKIIGVRAETELAEEIRGVVNAYPEVHGTYDLILHNYGPTQTIGSLHIEVDDSMTAHEIHKLTRTISADLYNRFSIIITVGIYASNDNTPKIREMKAQIEELIGSTPEILQMHGFYVDAEQMTVTFDMVVDFKADAQKIRKEICEKVQEMYPEYTFSVILDADYA